MLAKTETVALVGADARLVQVEVDVADGGMPGFKLVGLAATAIREAEQRMRSALVDIVQKPFNVKVVANLAPAGLRKEGTHFDLPLALGVLAGHRKIRDGALEGWVCLAELGLDGSLRRVPGVLPAAIAARQAGRRGVVCAAGDAHEAGVVEGIEVLAAPDLTTCVAILNGEREADAPGPAPPSTPAPPAADLSEVRGQERARRALEIAAAGAHNLLLIGPPGSGKTMLARRLPGILPAMTLEERFEVTKIYSVAGLLEEGSGLVPDRPFRNPHANVSVAALIGGGTGVVRPGEVSLANRGVLFLDELTLFRRDVLEALRAPLEDGVVHVARASGVCRFPARFSLIAAMNPCPCGHHGDARRPCTCAPHALQTYLGRVSGPLLDRFDMHVRVQRLDKDELMLPPGGETSAAVRERVQRARCAQDERFGSGRTNASSGPGRLEPARTFEPAARELIRSAVDSLALTARGFTRVLRVARTIADLRGGALVSEEDVIEATSLRLCGIHEEAA